jgi:hypothetical protein
LARHADARVQEASPSSNYGTSYLRTDGGSDPDVESYVRFVVSGVSGTVREARLRLYAYSGTSDGPSLYSSTNDWTEGGITWANRPARTTVPLGDKGSVATNTWVEYDVKPVVTGNGTYTFVLAVSSTDGANIYSGEAAANRPELVVSFE